MNVGQDEFFVEHCVFSLIFGHRSLLAGPTILELDERIHLTKCVMVLKEICLLNDDLQLAFLVQWVLILVSRLWLKIRFLPMVSPCHHDFTDLLGVFDK